MQTRAAYLAGKGELVLEEKELTLGPDEVMVKTHKASICGTDKNIYAGFLPPGYSYPVNPFGHEGGGTVVDTGSRVTEYEEGDQVMAFGEWAGTFSSYFKANTANIYRVPSGLELDYACLGEPAACAIYSVFNSGIQPGDKVAVIGLGFAGQIMIQGARLKGAAEVTGVDLVDEKLKKAEELGADHILNPDQIDIKEEVLALTRGKGVDVVFEAAGTEDSINTATAILKANGIMALYSWAMEPVRLNISRWHDDALDIRTTCLMHLNPPHERDIWFNRTLEPIKLDMIKLDPLITHSFRLSEISSAFDVAANDPGAIKVEITP